jgi:hypothetical protein
MWCIPIKTEAFKVISLQIDCTADVIQDQVYYLKAMFIYLNKERKRGYCLILPPTIIGFLLAFSMHVRDFLLPPSHHQLRVLKPFTVFYLYQRYTVNPSKKVLFGEYSQQNTE